MNPIERYDNIINNIEDMIEEDPYKDIHKITSELMKNIGITTRDIAVVIKFFTDMSLAEYVRKRKMNYSYKKLQEQPEYDLDSVIDYTGYSDHPAYSKAFKKEYGISPKKAYDEGKNLEKPPLTIETLQNNNIEVKPRIYAKKSNIFGVDKETYDRILLAEDLKELYGFNKAQANIAFHYAEEGELPLDFAFEDTSEAFAACDEILGIETKNFSESKMQEILNAWHNVYYSFDGLVPTSQIIRLCCRARAYNIKLTDIDENFGEYYMSVHLLTEDYVKAYKVYLEYKDEFEDEEEINDFFENLGPCSDGEAALGYVLSLRNIDNDIINTDLSELYRTEDSYADCLDKAEHQDFYGNEYTNYTEDYNPNDPFDEKGDIDDPDYYYRKIYRENDFDCNDKNLFDEEDDDGYSEDYNK